MNLYQHAHRPRRAARNLLWLLRREISVENPPALFKRLKMVACGFYSNKYFYYDFEKYALRDFLTDAAMYRTYRINGPYRHLLDSKIAFAAIMPRWVSTPRNLAWLHDGKIKRLENDSGLGDVRTLVTELEENGRLVLKPVIGLGGQGVLILSKSEGQVYINNKAERPEKAYLVLASLKNYIITEFIEQGEFPSSLFPESVNTIRLLTMVDPDGNEPFVAAAAHRIGNRKSAPVDNLHAGALSSLIDLDTGALSAAAERAADRLIMHDVHPDTQASIKGRIVPNWAALKAYILKVAAQLPFLCYVGWDVVLTADGPVLLEGNKDPNPRPFQLHRPLLLDDRIRRFYQKHDII
jgi:hypothetical protein